MACELSHNNTSSQKRNTAESSSSVCNVATHIDRIQGDSINGNLISREYNNQAMPDITRTQDINCGLNTDGSSLDLNSQMADLETNANHSKQHQHHNVSSSWSSSSVSSSATEPTVQASTEAVPTSGHAMLETDCEPNMNITHTMQEQSDVDSSTPFVDQDSLEEKTSADSLFGETRTIFKEDGLKDIMITVPVLEKLPETAGNTHSGSKMKPNNGHRPIKSGNQQMRKRPVLVRKATPIKIETQVKVLNDKVNQMSRENSFAEEEEEEEEEDSATGVST